MMYLLDAISFAFKESFKWKNIKFALINGLIVTLFWLFIAYFLWDYLIALTASFVEMFPFSMVRADAAWILSSVLFFQIILVTFALFMAFFGEFFLKKNKEKYTLYTVFTFLASVLFWGFIWFLKGDVLYNEILKILMWFPFQTLEKGIAFFIAIYIIYNAIIVTILLTTSILSDKIILHSFAQNEVDTSHRFASIIHTFKDIIIFFIASILLFVVLFIPVINIFVQILLWVFLIKDTIVNDALFLVYGKADKELKKAHTKEAFIISFIASLFNFFPIIYVFSPLFAELAMFKYFKSIKDVK